MRVTSHALMMGPNPDTDMIPADHPLRAIRALLQPVLQPRFAGVPVEDVAGVPSLRNSFCACGLRGGE